MAVAKSNQEIKKEKRREKSERIERITNMYMINLSWGILAIVLLRAIESGYGSADTILVMPAVMKSAAAILAIAAAALFACAKTGTLKNTSRAKNYAIFSLVAAVVSACIAFFAKIRMAVCGIIPALTSVDSRWWISWGWVALIVVYLVAALVWTAVTVARVEKGK